MTWWLDRIDDHVMLGAHRARERSVEEYTNVFKAVSDGFDLVGVTGHGPGVHNSLVEYKFTKKE
jgi:hypothetical protein